MNSTHDNDEAAAAGLLLAVDAVACKLESRTLLGVQRSNEFPFLSADVGRVHPGDVDVLVLYAAQVYTVLVQFNRAQLAE